MSNFIQVTPFIHVEDLERAVSFFTDILGFETLFRANNYAYVRRETAGFRILEQSGTDGAPPGSRFPGRQASSARCEQHRHASEK